MSSGNSDHAVPVNNRPVAPYTAIYRRWRPQLFAQVLGQEHVTRSLQNALVSGRVAHAYLFCGLRGTGKTTMAKLLGKALNCLEGVNAEPCNSCRSCVEVTEGRNLDVLEIDAASNRGIDEIRELRENVRYAAAQNRYKVYIIDEVHMLTTEAFNALLKVLEEPPPKVVFILATTEVHKIPLTIVSRCQRYDFHLLDVEQLSGRLRSVAEEMNFNVDEKTLILLARQAEGAVRDALGLLEQCRAYGGEEITYEQALEILGLPAPAILHRYYQAVIDEDLAAGLAVIREVVRRGMDLQRLLREQILYLRKLLLLQAEHDESTVLNDVPALKPYLLQHRELFDPPLILEMLEILQQLVFQLRGTSQPQFLLELAFLRLARAYRFRSYFSPGELVKRLEELEQKLLSAGQGRLEPAKEQNSAAITAPAPKPGYPEKKGQLPVADKTSVTHLPTDKNVIEEIQTRNNNNEETAEELAEAFDEAAATTPPDLPEQMDSSPEPAPPAPELDPANSNEKDSPALPGELGQFWQERFLAKLRKERKYNLLAYLMEAAPLSWKGGIFAITIQAKQSYLKKRLDSEKNRKYIESILKELLEAPAALQVVISADTQKDSHGSSDVGAKTQVTEANRSEKKSFQTSSPGVPAKASNFPPSNVDDDDFMRQALEFFNGRLISSGSSRPSIAQKPFAYSDPWGDDVPLPSPPPIDEFEDDEI